MQGTIDEAWRSRFQAGHVLHRKIMELQGRRLGGEVIPESEELAVARERVAVFEALHPVIPTEVTVHDVLDAHTKVALLEAAIRR